MCVLLYVILLCTNVFMHIRINNRQKYNYIYIYIMYILDKHRNINIILLLWINVSVYIYVFYTYINTSIILVYCINEICKYMCCIIYLKFIVTILVISYDIYIYI